MSGTFILGELKKRPGVFHRRVNADGVSLSNGFNGVGAGVIKANWGPINTVVDFDTSTDVFRIFGRGNTEDLITEMFNGGISSGKFVRIGKGGVAPSVNLTLEDGTTEAGKITGAYVGDRNFTVTIRDGISDDKRECIIYEGTSEFTKAEFEAGDNEIDALKAALEAATKDFIVSKTESGSGPLADVVQKKFTSGTNPTTTAEEYAAGLSVLEAIDYNVLCVDTDDTAIHALVAAFVNRTYSAGAFPMACIAEKKSIPLESRMSNSAAFNNEKIHYCLNAAYDADGNEYDGYRLAARIGGMIASVESNISLTHTVVPGLVSTEAMTNTQIEKALSKGCLLLTENRSGNVHIEQGINTLVSPPESMDNGWKKIRRVKTRFELMRRIITVTEPLIGNVDNDSDGRATIMASAQGIINEMIAEGKVTAGEIRETETNATSVDDAQFEVEVYDLDSAERLYITFMFHFSNITT